MNLTTFETIKSLYPQVVRGIGDKAYDEDGNEIDYDINAVSAKVTSDEQTKLAAHTSALAKLKKLGLTDDEISALKGTL
jgi:hypothetical protein